MNTSCMLQFQFEIRYDDKESDPPLEMMDETKLSYSEAGIFVCVVLINLIDIKAGRRDCI